MTAGLGLRAVGPRTRPETTRPDEGAATAAGPRDDAIGRVANLPANAAARAPERPDAGASDPAPEASAWDELTSSLGRAVPALIQRAIVHGGAAAARRVAAASA